MVAHFSRQLRRSNRNRIILGVAGGLGEYFGLDPVLFRVIFVVSALAGGVGLIAYLVLALILPASGEDDLDDGATHSLDDTTGGLWAGGLAALVLVGLGLLFLAGELGWLARIHWGVVWSLLLIGLGMVMVLRRAR